MLELDKVECEEFAACLNQDFEIVFPDGTLVLKLSEARQLGSRPESVREPFSLTFLGRRCCDYRRAFTNAQPPARGDGIFLVPIGADQSSSTFEAVFN